MIRIPPQRGSIVYVVVLSLIILLSTNFAFLGGRCLLSGTRGGGYYLASAFVVQKIALIVSSSSSTASSLSSSLGQNRRDIGRDNSNSSWRIKAESTFDDNSSEPRTGWLHNTEPKEYYRRVVEDEGDNDNDPLPSSEDKDDTTNQVVTIPFFSENQSLQSNTAPDHAITTPSFTMSKSNCSLNHRIIAPPAFHPCDGTTKFMVTEHKISVPLYHADLEIAAKDAAETNANNSIMALDRNAILSAMTTTNILSDKTSRHPMIDIYFAVIETTTSSSGEEYELFIASISDPTLCPRTRADAYLMQRGARSSDGDERSSSIIDASRMMLYLQGGPGFGCAAPSVGLGLASSSSSWAAKVLSGGGVTNTEGKTFERIVLMDQRGTGRSTPISKRRLERLFPDLFLLDDCNDERDDQKREKVAKAVGDATEYLAKFRADSIVRDAEWIKEALIRRPSPPTTTTETESRGENGLEASSNVQDGSFKPEPWGAALGQSYGGFCLMTYLSSFVHPPKLCLFTGGIAPAYTPVREVYDRLWPRVAERNYKYYGQYPGDIGIVKRIVQRLLSSSMPPVKLPSGGVLTARRFLQLGLSLGGSPGTSFANLHSLINSAFLYDEDDVELSGAFLKRIDHEQSFDDAPLYFLLHESIYADGPTSGPTEWAAHSSYENIIVSTHPEFDFLKTSAIDDNNRPTLFFGEMVFPWMAHGDYAELSGNGLKSLSGALAGKRDWSPLYDKMNMRLSLLGGGVNSPPKSKAASATYYDDMYVDFDCAMKLLGRGAPLDGVKVWITNEYQHSGLRDDGANILCKLVNMAKENVYLPS